MSLLSTTLKQIVSPQDPELRARIQHRLDHLTKPRGSLGRLEEVVVRYGLARGDEKLQAARKAMFVFCADHGITDEAVSAYPRDVTHQMVRNFAGGGAAINVLCRQYDIDPVIIDIGVEHPLDGWPTVISRKVASRTRNFLREPAMTREQAVQSIETGISMAKAAEQLQYTLAGVGDMGIGNTTASAAVTAAILRKDPAEVAGHGAGLSDKALEHKVSVIRQALDLHQPDSGDPLAVLSSVGGFEIGGIAGFVLGAAASRIPVVIDGFIASAAALLAVRLAEETRDYLFFSHASAERGHGILLDFLQADPLLRLDMRLGEGSGAALAMGLIDSAVRLYREMATFESAGVSQEAPDATQSAPKGSHIESNVRR